MMEARSWLFVPADDGDKVAKAIGGEADIVILDCEDSVAEANKEKARKHVAAVIERAWPENDRLWVRINPLDGPFAENDINTIAPESPAGVMLPKSESGEDVKRLAAMLDARGADNTKIIALVTETPASLFGAGSYQGASERLAALTWGAEDLSSALGASGKFDEAGDLDFTYKLARSLCLAGAVAAGVQPGRRHLYRFSR